MNNDPNMRIRPSRLVMALPIAVVAFSLAACSGPGRPSVDDVSEGLQQFFEEQGQPLSEDASDCFAEALVDSEISDETLGYIADGEDRQKDEADKALTTQILQENVVKCAGDE